MPHGRWPARHRLGQPAWPGRGPREESSARVKRSYHTGGTKFSDTSTALETHWCGLGAVLPSQAENPHPSATSKARMRASKSLAWWRFTPGLKGVAGIVDVQPPQRGRPDDPDPDLVVEPGGVQG